MDALVTIPKNNPLAYLSKGRKYLNRTTPLYLVHPVPEMFCTSSVTTPRNYRWCMSVRVKAIKMKQMQLHLDARYVIRFVSPRSWPQTITLDKLIWLVMSQTCEFVKIVRRFPSRVLVTCAGGCSYGYMHMVKNGFLTGTFKRVVAVT